MKLLIISNQCLDKSTSNGRTLINFLGAFLENNDVLNVYISGQEYNNDNIKYIRVSDSYVLKSFLTLGLFKYKSNNQNGPFKTTQKRKNKSPLKMLFRDMVWNSCFWYKKTIKNSIKLFDPDAILLFGADMPFFYKFSLKISKKNKCPLFIFTTEDYPLKKYNYISKKRDLFYRFFRCRLNKQAKKAFKYSSESFFNTESLMNAYIESYLLDKDRCNIVFSKSTLGKIDFSNNKNKLLYAGNLGVGRLDSLLEFAHVLKQINQNAVIDVYSKIDEEKKKRLESVDNINYLGFIEYSKLIEKYHNYGILLHTEGFGKYNELDLKYAFTSKLPDLIESESLFVFYASEKLSETIFLNKIKCNTIASNVDELNILLKNIYSNKILKTTIDINNYQRLSNSKSFKEIISEVVYG